MANTRRAAHFENDAQWNAIWDEYDARKGPPRSANGAGSARQPGEPAAAPELALATGGPLARRGRRTRAHELTRSGRVPRRPSRSIGRAAVGALASGALLLGLWAALPWMLAMRVTASLRSPHPAALTRQFEPTVTIAGLREALLAEVPPGLDGAAGRWVADLAGRMVAAAEARGSATDWIARRTTTRGAEALPRQEVLRRLHILGPALFRLEYGPERGPGGMVFDLGWQGTDFRVVAIRSLEPPPRELPRLRAPGSMVAMR